ncbi:hypothetical protein [Fodinibius halophilus]|uniref:Uncharacterized protein n=1 Tax=Fodinibius halophilus TaxID=1736908 RepID=A0A6M1SZN8_9BACT|nr:hypothetical protein [Fodinibius halophilus]NGP87099.1 hypothetical protein [Fodinibius halophilus]
MESTSKKSSNDKTPGILEMPGVYKFALFILTNSASVPLVLKKAAHIIAQARRFRDECIAVTQCIVSLLYTYAILFLYLVKTGFWPPCLLVLSSYNAGPSYKLEPA